MEQIGLKLISNVKIAVEVLHFITGDMRNLSANSERIRIKRAPDYENHLCWYCKNGKFETVFYEFENNYDHWHLSCNNCGKGLTISKKVV